MCVISHKGVGEWVGIEVSIEEPPTLRVGLGWVGWGGVGRVEHKRAQFTCVAIQQGHWGPWQGFPQSLFFSHPNPTTYICCCCCCHCSRFLWFRVTWAWLLARALDLWGNLAAQVSMNPKAPSLSSIICDGQRARARITWEQVNGGILRSGPSPWIGGSIISTHSKSHALLNAPLLKVVGLASRRCSNQHPIRH